MSKRRNMNWQEAGVTEQVNTFSTGIKKSFPGECALFLVCALFFFLSACSMIENVFRWNVYTIGAGVRIVLCSLAVCVLMEACTLLKPTTAKWLRIGVAPAGCLLLLLFSLLTGRMGDISAGWSNITTAYGNYWNEYNGMDYSLYDGVNPDTEAAVLFGITLLCVLFVWMARLWGKTWILSLVPAGVFVAALLVGMSPNGTGLWLFAIGFFLAGAGAYKKAEFKQGEQTKKGVLRFLPWLPSAVIVLIVCFLVAVTGREKATDTVSEGRQKVNDTIEKVADWSGWDKFHVGREVEKFIRKFLGKMDLDHINVAGKSERRRLDNSTPSLSGRNVMFVASIMKPKETLYLQECYLDIYEDGEWYTDISAFERACKDAGFKPDSVSRSLADLAKTTMDKVAKAEPTDDDSWLDWEYFATLQYTSAAPDRTLFPYFSAMTQMHIITDSKEDEDGNVQYITIEDHSLQNEVYVDGHVRYTKSRNLSYLPIDLWDYDRTDLMNLIHAVECKIPKEQEPWEVWYESYLQKNYMTVPEGMPSVRQAATEANTQNLTFLRIEGENSVNAERLNKAYKVAHWLGKNAQYSLEPPELPDDTDPVEFFLGTSHQGYCMHFTSAAVLMLRSLGVPARYVSGYMPDPPQLMEDSAIPEERLYLTEVVESDAHAWVEIYLKGIGWIPVEVTSGNVEYIDECAVYKRGTDGRWLTEYAAVDAFGNGQNTQTTPGQQGTTPVPGTPENPQESPVTPDNPEPDDTKEESPEQKPEKKPGAAAKKTSVFGTMAMYAGITAGVAALVAAVLLWLRRKELSGQEGEERRFVKKTRRYGNRRRIRYLNQRLYRKLRRHRVLKRKPVWDTEYEKVLKEACTGIDAAEVERFMYLAKAAMFSYEEFSDEEVAFCKAFCHKVMYEEV